MVPNSCRNQGDSKGSRWWAPSRHHHFAACSRLRHTHEVFCVRSYKVQLRSQCRQNRSLNLGLSELQHWFPDSQNAVLLEFCIGNLWMQKLVLCCHCRERTQIRTIFLLPLLNWLKIGKCSINIRIKFISICSIVFNLTNVKIIRFDWITSCCIATFRPAIDAVSQENSCHTSISW